METSTLISRRLKTYKHCRPKTFSTSFPQSQENRIRSRLLNRLGILHHQKDSPSNEMPRVTRHELHSIQTKNQSVPFFQPLRDSDEHCYLLPTTIYPTTFTTSKHGTIRANISMKRTKTSRVRFDNKVLVVPIPSRHAYSNRIKKAFWRDGNELEDIADRNHYEYASEGSDWSKVLEDEDMYIDVDTGEKVHPC
ncbi:unnamed protein product [Pseudo-nitzschia multistriata]|uniref:Uncharacterized protein n=1 Tax=Pseudo-nitzschia multistriata TaxID=183589 RepID=A0A448Z5R0_9STRA|nr:unnamed protein product [Pseudo-nitzschia multistriata]